MTIAEHITKNLKTPFACGEFDCVKFVAQWVEQATGVDYLAEVPQWSNSNLQAARLIRDLGGMEKLMDERFQSIHPNLACDGDLGFYEESVGIFSGPHIVGPGKTGLFFIDRTKASRAWSLPNQINQRGNHG